MSNFFIVTHGINKLSTSGLLEIFLRNEGNSVTRLINPLYMYAGSSSGISKDNRSHYINRHNVKGFYLLEDILIAIKSLSSLKQPTKVIATTNIDVIPAVIAKLVNKNVTEIIYYPRDYSANKYKNSVLNFLYYSVERLAVRFSTSTISNTSRAADERYKLGLKLNKSIIIPNGTNLFNMTFEPKKFNKSHFMYIGEVSKEHGLYDFIAEYKSNIKKLVIIGLGEDWNRVIKLCDKSNISVEHYHNKSNKFVIEKLKQFDGFGIAPYNTKSMWTYYCSPLKVVEYVSCNLPVIISSVPEIANEIKQNKLGIVYETLDQNELKAMMRDFDVTDFNRRAQKFYANHTYSYLYKRVFINA